MSDETDTTSEVARVLGEHTIEAVEITPQGDYLVCARCGGLAMGTMGPQHQAAMLAEAGLLREMAPIRDPECPCAACDPGLILDGEPTGFPSRMSVCPSCGNKRCPKAANHAKWQCGGSNAVGQVAVRAETNDENEGA